MNKLKKILLCIVMFQIVLFELCVSEDTSTNTSLEEFLSKIKYPPDVPNEPIVEISYGISYPSFYDNIFRSQLSKTYSMEIKYGFCRIDTQKIVPELITYANEFTFLRNISSHLKPRSWIKRGITQDNWNFGFGFSNGSGFKNENARIIFYNTGRIVWSRIDFELDANNKEDQDRINLYDSQYRFGSEFDMGVKIQVQKVINLDLCYSHTLVFPRHLFLQWVKSSSLELVIQRTIDYFETELMLIEMRNYPVMNFLLKNAVSLGFYEFRRRAMNWPFKSEAPLNYDSFVVGFSLIF